MNFRFLYFFAAFLAAVLTFGCGGGSDPEPELTVLVQPPGEGPFPEGIFIGGQNVLLTATVSHAKGPGSKAGELQLYRSQDADISTDDSPEGEGQPVEALAPDASAEVTLTVTLPPMTGSYYYGACITLAGSNQSCSSGALIMVSESTLTVEPNSMTEASLTAGGQNYFRFTLRESIRGLAIHTRGEIDLMGSLYDGQGTPLAAGEMSGDQGNFRIDRPLAPGTYFVRVQGGNTSVEGNYTLHVERGPRITNVRLASVTDRTLAVGVSDYFQLTLGVSQSLAIHTSGDIDTSGGIYDGRGVLLATDENSGDRNNFRIERLLDAGTYFIRVSGSNFGTAQSYTLHVIPLITPGSTFEGTLVAGGTDHFQLTLESTQHLAIYTSGEGLNTTGGLYDSDGMAVATDEDSGEGDHFRIGRLLTLGTYFIQVTGADISVTGGYTLHVELPGITTVQLGSTTERTLAAGVSDYFQLTLTSVQGVAIHTQGDIDVTGILYDADVMQLATDENGGEGLNFRIDRPLALGTYLIEVRGVDTSIEGNYRLRVEGNEATVKPGSVTASTLVAGRSGYFQFTLPDTDTLASDQSMAIYTIGETNVTGRLYDSDGTLLFTDENSGEGDNFRIDRMLAAGTYLIRVTGADTSVQGNYTLRVMPVITTGSITAGTLPAGSSDYFQLTLTQLSWVIIYTQGDIDVTGRLHDFDGMPLTTDENGGDDDNFRIERPLAPGTYLIEVTGADMSVQGSYTLHLEGAGITTIKPGSVTSANLSAGVSDYFQLTLTGPQNLAIYTSGTTNTTGRLYDSDGTLLVTDENSGEGDNFRIEPMLTPGTYFIRVGGDSSSTRGSYTLNIIPMVTPGSMTASSLSAGGSDYFQLTLTGNQGIAIYTSGMTNTTGRLYDSDGMLLTTDEDSGDMSNFRIDLILDMGTYLIQVDGADRNVMGAYTLHVVGSTVTTVMLGSMTNGMLAAGAGDYFKFTLASDQGLAIYTSGTTDTTGRLYNSDFVLMATNEVSGNFRIDRPLVPGTYFIRVSGNTATVSGAYTLNITGASVTAATVNPETAPDYTLTAGVSDYFKLTLASAQPLTVSTSGMTDTTGTLYNDSGALLAMAESGGDMSNFRIDRPLAADTYFIRVSGNTATVSGAYTLNITGASVTTVMLDAMNTGTVMGTLAAGGSDYFQLTLTGNRGVVIYTSGMVNTTGSLYNSYGVLLATDENSGDDDNFRIELPLAAGTYFIKVEGADMSASGAYTLNITAADMVTKLTVPSMAGDTSTSRQTPSPATGTDYFWFQVDTSRTLSIFYSGSPPGNATLRITVYDANANILVNPNDARSGSRSDGSEFRARSVEFASGTYFLAVHADNYNTHYTINIKWGDI